MLKINSLLFLHSSFIQISNLSDDHNIVHLLCCPLSLFLFDAPNSSYFDLWWSKLFSLWKSWRKQKTLKLSRLFFSVERAQRSFPYATRFTGRDGARGLSSAPKRVSTFVIIVVLPLLLQNHRWYFYWCWDGLRPSLLDLWRPRQRENSRLIIWSLYIHHQLSFL